MDSSEAAAERGAGRYSIIYADPPWDYRDECASGERGASFKYHTMPLPRLCALSVDGRCVYDLAADRSVCFMWYTKPFKEEALFLLRAWGFKPVQDAFDWVKTTRTGRGVHFGMGTATRANMEYVAMGVRGVRLKRRDAGVSSLVVAPVGAHGAKPGIVRRRIVRLYGDLPRVELFATQRARGWDSWGLAIDEELRVVRGS